MDFIQKHKRKLVAVAVGVAAGVAYALGLDPTEVINFVLGLVSQ